MTSLMVSLSTTRTADSTSFFEMTGFNSTISILVVLPKLLMAPAESPSSVERDATKTIRKRRSLLRLPYLDDYVVVMSLTHR